jgi:hypothetical protein
MANIYDWNEIISACYTIPFFSEFKKNILSPLSYHCKSCLSLVGVLIYNFNGGKLCKHAFL